MASPTDPFATSETLARNQGDMHRLLDRIGRILEHCKTAPPKERKRGIASVTEALGHLRRAFDSHFDQLIPQLRAAEEARARAAGETSELPSEA